MRVKDIWWHLALIIAFIIFIVVLALLTEGTCRHGYVWIDDELGRGCIPWEVEE